jgi:germination protein M
MLITLDLNRITGVTENVNWSTAYNRKELCMWHRQSWLWPFKRHDRPTSARGFALIVAVFLIIPLAACTMSPSQGSTATSVAISSSTATSGAVSSSTATTGGEAATSTPITQAPATAAASPEATPGATVAPTVAASPDANTLAISVYFLRNKKIMTARRSIADTQQIGTAALKELLKGPNSAEKAAGLSTSLPKATTLLGLSIADKVATVNLSSDFGQSSDSQLLTERLAQVVYTLTQFPTVTTVSFQLDGEGITKIGSMGMPLSKTVGRSDYESVTPAIFLDSPPPGDIVTTPLHLIGTANTFEAAFTIDIVDASGNVLTEQHAQATSGSGTRGTFDITVPYKVAQQQAGKVVLFEVSAKDGAKTNQVEVPVTLTP